MSALTLTAAVAGYRGRRVLGPVDAVFGEGEFWVIGGPNGGGKSTLLKTIAGLLPLLSGQRTCAPGLRFGYVPQQTEVEPPLPVTALEWVELGAATRRGPVASSSREEREFCLECLRECCAEALAGQRFEALSGGQRQRVLLARALAVCPTALVLDEPTAGVDPETATLLADRLARANREEGMLVLVVTHAPEIFREIPHRRARVEGGAFREEAAL